MTAFLQIPIQTAIASLAFGIATRSLWRDRIDIILSAATPRAPEGDRS